MIFSRLISLILRVSQFVFAAIVLGLTAYFVYKIENPDRGPRGRRDRRDRWDDDDRWDPARWRDDDDRDPLGRLIFALVWSSLSIIFAVIWAIPTTFAMKGFISDFSEFILYSPSPSWWYANSECFSLHSRLGRCLRTPRRLVQRRQLR